MKKNYQNSNTNTFSLDRKTLYRAYNGLIACAVLSGYLTDPKAAAYEYLPDIFIHAFEALAPEALNEFAILTNTARATQAACAFFSGHSSIPHVANGVDVLNHAVNIYHRATAAPI